jgi:hypothetical protein
MPNFRFRSIGAGLSVALVLWFVSGNPAWAQDDGNKDKPSASDVAQELANPNTSLGFLAFQLDHITYDGDLPDADDQDAWKLSFQPSIPYPLGDMVRQLQRVRLF